MAVEASGFKIDSHLIIVSVIRNECPHIFYSLGIVKQNKSNNPSPQLEEGNGVGDFKEPLQGTDEGNVSAFKKKFQLLDPAD